MAAPHRRNPQFYSVVAFFAILTPSIRAVRPSGGIFGTSTRSNTPSQTQDTDHKLSSIYYNPHTSWRRCNVQDNGNQWVMCLGSQGGAYSLCPIEDEFDLEIVEGPYYFWGAELRFQQCMHCPAHDPVYGQNCASSIETLSEMFDLSTENKDSLLELCTNFCEGGTKGEFCSRDEPCSAASHFCDFDDVNRISGVCQECPTDINDCYEAGFLAYESGRSDCLSCRMHCDDFGQSKLVIDDVEIPTDFMHLAMQESILAASGLIIDCSDLVRLGVDICNGARDKVCLVEANTRNIKYWDLSQKAEDSGCVALILNATYNETNSNACGFHSYDGLEIPFVCISSHDGRRIKTSSIGKMATVEVKILGQACQKDSPRGSICSEKIPCSAENEFCPYDKTVVDGEYIEGWCKSCPTDGYGNPSQLSCYFDFYEGYARASQYVVDCVKSCDAQVQFGSCKFCPDGLNALDFGVDNEANKCHFCPKYDIKYPDRLVPVFGDNITCWQMQEFYESVDINENSQNCALAQKMNFICGCDGTGYAGANTEAKQAVLAWLPRMMAILSIFGSLFILYDTTRTAQKRHKLLNQMLFTLSIFDILGSTAYAFTTLPTPKADYLYGSEGNQNTCIAQGFFIQVGTIACFLNVTLAMYYLLTIKYGWQQARLKSKRIHFFLPPILVGLFFAFIGVPFYDNALLWCNNTARYWPEIPVILAIVFATLIMCAICIDVRKKSRASLRYSSRRNSVTLSDMVFVQACWFTGAFYITWIPYLAIQYMWSSGKAYDMYGFILFASISVPLQGFWNFVVYVRPRYFGGPKPTDLPISRRVSLVTLRSSMSRLSFRARRAADEIALQNEENDDILKTKQCKVDNPNGPTIDGGKDPIR